MRLRPLATDSPSAFCPFSPGVQDVFELDLSSRRPRWRKRSSGEEAGRHREQDVPAVAQGGQAVGKKGHGEKAQDRTACDPRVARIDGRKHGHSQLCQGKMQKLRNYELLSYFFVVPAVSLVSTRTG